MEKNYVALITAAGDSRRIGGEKKELIKVDGKAIIYYAALSFVKTELFKAIFITCQPELEDEFRKSLEELTSSNIIKFVPGGKTRQESVFFGLKAMEYLNPEIVLIHDGARPFVTENLIKNIFDGTLKYGACAPLIPVVDSVKIVENNSIVGHPRRQTLMGIQTPQGFTYPEIFECHKKAKNIEKSFTDDTEIYSLCGKNIHIADGERGNIKITYPDDMKICIKHRK
ncbi:MAG: 2-C-methyl-D-erythritol 4-phosphate cytidylyltransferase [Spirochaetes bacterium]|nr:2-C-methyl-D-erythritol 4-phosphate cytidylyltransferase [Spirochaetota bacterium]